MIRILFLNSLIFLFCVNSVFAQQFVYDPSAAADRSVQALADKVHQAFTENKWVENIRVLNQNYNESKRFYDTMTELSKHKGGLLGYYQDRAIARFDRAGKSAYWRFETHMQSDPVDTAYVKNWMRKMDEKVLDATDFSKEIHALGEGSGKRIKELEDKTNKSKLAEGEYEKAMLASQVEQMKMLFLLNKSLLQMLERQREKDAAAWAAARAQMLDDAKADARLKDAWKKAFKEGKAGKKDPFEVLKELPR